MSLPTSQLAENNVMKNDYAHNNQLNSRDVNMNAQYTAYEPQQFQHSHLAMDYNQYNAQQKNDLIQSLAQNPHMLNDFCQFLEFTRAKSLQQSFPATGNDFVNQNYHQIPSVHNSKASAQYQSSTPKRSRPLNDSNGSISSAPKQHKTNNYNTKQIENTRTTNQQQRIPLPFDQLKRAISSNLPCFFIEFEQATSTHQLPSAFEARNLIEKYFKEHNVTIQQFSLVGWSGKRLKLGVNNKKDYSTLVTTENWPTLIKNIPVKTIKPKYIPDCFALVVRYVPHELEIETVKEELKRTITSADNIKQIHYTYERKSNDFRFTVSDLTEYNTALELGRISICNHWLAITPFLSGNRMTYCTRCWRIGHTREQCKLDAERCRVCLEEFTRREEHRCTNIAKCAQCDGEHHSLYSQCHVVQHYRAELKEDVQKAIESGKLQRIVTPKQQEFHTKNQEFPSLNGDNKFQQQQQNAWNRMQTEARRNDEQDVTKVLAVINENLVAMRESNIRVEAKLERIDLKVNQAALDAELHQTTIDNLIEIVQTLIEHTLWPAIGRLQPELLQSPKGLQSVLTKLGKLKGSLRDDYTIRRKRPETPPIQEKSTTPKDLNSGAPLIIQQS